MDSLRLQESEAKSFAWFRRFPTSTGMKKGQVGSAETGNGHRGETQGDFWGGAIWGNSFRKTTWWVDLVLVSKVSVHSI